MNNKLNWMRDKLATVKLIIKSNLESKVPDQRYFSIESLLERWKSDGVTFQHICDWVTDYDLAMGIRLRSLTDSEDSRVCYLQKSTLLGVLTLSSKQAVEVHNLFHTTTRSADSERMNVSIKFYSPSELNSTKDDTGSDVDLYEKSELLIPLTEVLRLEEIFKIGKKSPWWKFFAKHKISKDNASRITALYLGFMFMVFCVYQSNWSNSFQLNLLGDFLSGVSAPLTVLWLIVQFRQQASVSEATDKELISTARRQEQAMELQRKRIELETKRLEVELKEISKRLKPNLRLMFKGSRSVSSGVVSRPSFVIENKQARAKIVKVSVIGLEDSKDKEFEKEVKFSNKDESIEFELDDIKEDLLNELSVKVVYFRNEEDSLKYEDVLKVSEAGWL